MDLPKLSLLLSLFFLPSLQLPPSQTQTLLQLRKQLEYPAPLSAWSTPAADLCSLSSPQANITCDNNAVTGITIFGGAAAALPRPNSFDGHPSPPQTLSQNFSIDSLIATLSRLNNLRTLTLISLQIWGPLPAKIHRLQSLQFLDLSWNFLYGSVPPTLPRIVSLRTLKLDSNFFNGSFPNWLHSFSNLSSLSIARNFLTGSLPSSLQRVPTLTDVNLSGNLISGKVSDLSSLSRLTWLDLSSNLFDSELPELPAGVTAALLGNNSFSGRIPDRFAGLDRLRILDLSSNSLAGPIPGGIFALPEVNSINLSSNTLSGSIPERLICDARLVSVDISNNRLIGALPPCLRSSSVKSAGNCLSGSLRDQHSGEYCVEAARDQKNSRGKGAGVLIGAVAGIAVAVAVLAFGFVVLCRQYCLRGSSEQHLLHKAAPENSVSGYTAELLTNARFISDAAKLAASPPHRLFSLDELNAATGSFDELALMGEGSTGKMYKGRLESGARVVVRCLTVSRRYTIRNLRLRLDLLSKLRHPHLVCLLGHCIESQGKDESGANNVYLVYEYVPNGNYCAHLSETDREKALEWSDRLAIVTGVAKAVHFLHTGVIPGFFSNRLKTINILLNEHRIGKLSDYGLSVVAQELDKERDGLKTWQTKNLEDDVYSFGLILLESLIGPSVCKLNESFLHNEIVSLGSPEGQRRMVDRTVLATSCQESLSIVVSLTINCISAESSTRPSFEDILWNLQYAAQVQATSNGGSDPRTGKTMLSP
ncbi:probable inactive leucine-rich repeat receptor-like protein kinase At3g03770 [Andrographis paniculata]|uniref:probable inactive leucine-rich repeat receptor-like protein kinase At3g03770 n=1 Tax=Andrographis paniculata TaxID=175694 RepID=UPI0021E6FF5B|nr:probable inactive leucine-rich repeat receptor-like protein kinase At3g03770 [Andrographis paniculata]